MSFGGRVDVGLPKYGRIHLFTCFVIGFTALAILILKYWRLFFVYWRYGCKGTC